jgi:Asp-tRNA(Asn)/Glu-tRNA(Gln) amidotransferase A subunit family amidase
MPYDLRHPKVPRLTGVALSALASAMETPVASDLLAARLLQDAGLDSIRSARVDEPPSVLPPLPRPATLHASAAPPELDLARIADGASRPASGFAFESASDLGRAYRDGKATPAEVADRLAGALRRAAALEPPLAAITTWREDQLREQAAASTERWRAGRPLSPLDGVPVAVKEELDVEGYPTTAGTSYLRDVAAADAAVVARLRAAGAIVYGKSNMVEIGIDTLGFNGHHGTARNPYGREHRYAGGSSTGSGVAVAAGLGPIAVGADGGGSVRIPAAMTGVVGLKATHGRISEKGAFPLCWSVGHVGPIGATVRDVALAYAVMAGPVADDPVSLAQPAPTLEGLDATGRLDGLRVGVYRPWFDDADADVVRVCRGALDGLVAAGATLVDVEIDDLELGRVAHAITILAEMATTMDRYTEHRRSQGAAVRINLALARALTARDYVQAQRVRTRLYASFARAFERCDAIATPTCAITAPAVGRDVAPRGESNLTVTSAMMRFVLFQNLTGHPAISVPAGYDTQGLPVGLQLTGRPWEEHVILRVAEAAERRLARHKPELWLGPLLA